MAARGERLSILLSSHVHPSLHHAKHFCWVLLHNFLPAFCLSVTHLAPRGEPKQLLGPHQQMYVFTSVVQASSSKQAYSYERDLGKMVQ